mmetsp:Transcript_19578/g.46506  ORF Transcript_19578/g.46506 Transcript_19578/m.46506 type:complete len:691 (-) Transcript_19578:123-2195(-)
MRGVAIEAALVALFFGFVGAFHTIPGGFFRASEPKFAHVSQRFVKQAPRQSNLLFNSRKLGLRNLKAQELSEKERTDDSSLEIPDPHHIAQAAQSAQAKQDGVFWKDASPQRTVDPEEIQYLNQFPNTWQPAETIALKASGAEQDTVSTAGIEFKVASTQKLYDAAIVGTGPAACAIAEAMAKEGMRVAIVGPIKGAWPNNYGVWMDEWEELGLPRSCVEYEYKTTRITIASDNSIEIPRPYGKVSGQETRKYLLQRCAAAGVEVREGIVTRVEHGGGDTPSRLHLKNTQGESIQCRVPVVAAGHYSPLVKYQSPGVEYMRIEGEYMTRNWDTLLQTPPDKRPRITKEDVPSGPLSQMSWKNSIQFNSVRPLQHTWGWNWGWNPALRGIRVPDVIPFFGGSEAIGGGAPGYQIAYGKTVECATPHGFPLGEMLLMDFSTDHLVGDDELEGGLEDHTPTFLYAFPYDEKRVFLQETLLVARNHRAKVKSLEMEEMVRRVGKRIAQLNLDVVREYDKEYSVIPMGGPLPVLGQPTLAYGAAAVMVHPASGYMINRVLLQAPEVAKAIADTLQATGSPQAASEAGWEALWPKHRLIERDLYCFGMEVLLDLDVRLLRDFFAAFFADPKEQMWRQFLAWDMTKPGQKPWKMSIFMILMFFRGSPRLKGQLVKEAMFKDGLHLLKSIFELPFPFD